jgi:hypothetical protein
VVLAGTLVLSGAVGAERGPAGPGTDPPGGGSPAVLEPSAARPKSRRKRVIFTCTTEAVVEFSDKPCAPASSRRTLEFTTGAGAAPSTRPSATTASTRPKPMPTPASTPDDTPAGSRDAAAQARQCSTLETQLDSVDKRMRRGYAAREAADLWNRWRDLKEQLRVARC